ncbi:MAG: GNAT family N-acetyltransferase [Clostridia bacterium]|nr:GNAT family N-acetyltransferase [Clostridia bacterium]
MIRKMTGADKSAYLAMTDIFHNSDAVLHPIDIHNYNNTFSAAISDSPYVDGFILEKDSLTCGYAIVSLQYSTEVGGLCAWIEELYVSEEYRGKGLGSEFLAFVHKFYKERVKRIRLEVEEENSGAVKLYKKNGYAFLPYEQMINDDI